MPSVSLFKKLFAFYWGRADEQYLVLEKGWQSTPVFLPEESRGQRSLAGYSPWGRKSQTQLSN